jgi:hypothetical protein
MSCLFCTYFTATEPVEHRQQREAGTCPDGCGRSEWTPANAMRYVKRTNANLVGDCRVGAATLQKYCTGICGEFELVEKEAPYELRVTPRKPGEHLHEWAREQMRLWIHGTYRDNQLAEAQQAARWLKRELAAARKRSAARLEKIRKLEGKSAKRPRLRLVHNDHAPAEPPLPMSEAAD